MLDGTISYRDVYSLIYSIHACTCTLAIVGLQLHRYHRRHCRHSKCVTLSKVFEAGCLGITRGCRSALEDARWSRGSEYFGVRSLPLFPPAKLSRGSLRKARSGFRRAGERLAVEIEREATREDENRAIRARYA